MRKFFVIFLIFMTVSGFSQRYSTIRGQVDFVSNAPLEVIKANSNELQGVLDLSSNTFAFKMYIKSFDGFNSPLQKIHFFENYMEVGEFPIATFTGKVLEEIVEENTNYRAKGEFEIHGIKVERIIPIKISKTEKTIFFNAEFSVPLDDHDIELPRIVYQKIAEEIEVSIRGELDKRE